MTLPTAPTPKPAPPQAKLAPAWQRPLVRWATRFSLAAPRWLPTWLRHAPMKAISYALRVYYKGWD
jgi:hypothetical protein